LAQLSARIIAMERQDPELLEIWTQKAIPVVYRQGESKPILLRLLYASNNRGWLRGAHRRDPKWDPKLKCWETPKSWFDDIIRRALQRFGRVYVIQPYRTHQRCAPACWNATGFQCECSCMGENHGTGIPAGKWHVVSQTLAVRWGTHDYACRLIQASADAQLVQHGVRKGCHAGKPASLPST
jgi:hypothetical protein